MDGKETVVDPCGCVWERRQVASNMFYGQLKEECLEHEQKRVAELAAKELEQANRFKNLEHLNCDECGNCFGMCYANDLNGSRFYCLQCYKENS
jgi:hypothetical protein